MAVEPLCVEPDVCNPICVEPYVESTMCLCAEHPCIIAKDSEGILSLTSLL